MIDEAKEREKFEKWLINWKKEHSFSIERFDMWEA